MPATPSKPADEPMILPVCAIFRRFLKRQGLKFTTERALILDAVLSRDDVFEADQLFTEMRAAGHRVGKATIYRNLKHLVEAHIVEEVLIDPRQTHYRLSFGREAKGHLVCVETNRIVEFPIADLQAIAERICAEHGFEMVNYRFAIYGTSPEAQAHELAEHSDDD